MSMPEKKYKNKAIVELRNSGWKFSHIAKAFEEKDKRNIVRKYKRWREKYGEKKKNKD